MIEKRNLAERERDTERYILSTFPVLYLPLWKLDGASFLSRDGHGHLCTVTGATWGSQGRTFNGVDDKLDIPANSAFSNHSQFTLLIWLKMGALEAAVKTPFQTGEAATYRIVFNVNQKDDGSNLAGAIRFHVRTTGDVVLAGGTTTGVLDTTNFTHLALKYDQVNVSLYKDLQLLKTVAGTAAMTGADPAAAYIGSSGGSAQFIPGIIGELFYYNRALTPQEVQHNFIQTRWRYQ